MTASPKTTEDVLWGWLNTVKAIFKRDLHMTRVENAVGPGWPDVEGMLTSNQFFIELKCSPRPAYDYTNIKVNYRPKQPPWHKRRLQAGARIFTLVQVGSGAEACRYLIGSEHLETVKAGITEDRMAELSLCDGRATARQIVSTAAYAPSPSANV